MASPAALVKGLSAFAHAPAAAIAAGARTKRGRVTVAYDEAGGAGADAVIAPAPPSASTKRARSRGAGAAGAGAGAGAGTDTGAGVGSGAGAGAGASSGAVPPASPSRAPPPPVEENPASPSRGYGKPIEPFGGWREHLATIKTMRAVGGAPVDTMGCERCADPAAPPPVQRWQTLVGLLLSSQTKDPVTFAAVQRLRALPGGCTAHSIAATSLLVLEQTIHPVGFFHNKAKFLRGSAEICVRDYGGDIPPTIATLVKLPGIGPKMAFLAMQCAWDRSVGIGVDTHVHRIANRLRWVKTNESEGTRMHLQSWLPREEWGGVNALLVGLGQTVCTPLRPKCGECALQSFCPEASGPTAALAVARTMQGAGGGAGGGLKSSCQ